MDWLIINFENSYNAIKYHGVIKGIDITLRYLIINTILAKFNIHAYKFHNLKFSFDDFSSLKTLFSELLCMNNYFFKTDNSKPIIVDLGANVGDSLIYFKYLYPDSVVYAFEPHPKAFSQLNNNVLINQFHDVYPFNLAVSNKKGSLEFFSDSTSHFRGASTLKEVSTIDPKNIKKKHDSFKISAVPLSGLNELKKLKKIDMLKIDVEGAEASIISEIYQSGFINKVKRIAMEYHIVDDAKVNSIDLILTSLRKSGFTVSVFHSYKDKYNQTHADNFIVYAVRA